LQIAKHPAWWWGPANYILCESRGVNDGGGVASYLLLRSLNGALGFTEPPAQVRRELLRVPAAQLLTNALELSPLHRQGLPDVLPRVKTYVG